MYKPPDFFHVLNPSQIQKAFVQTYFDRNKSLSCAWVERTSHPTHLETVIHWALVEGHTNLAIWGGDGTLNRVLQFLYENQALEKTVLRLYPAGTCNDFHRKMTGGTLPSVADSQEGDEKYLDLGVLECAGLKRVFINNAGFGRTPSAVKKKKSNPVQDIFALTAKDLHLEWSENGQFKTADQKALLGVACNAPYFNCGLHFSTSVDPMDGKLNLFLEEPQGKWNLLFKFLRGRRGRVLSSSHTREIGSSLIKISSSSDLYPQTDGEPVAAGGVRALAFSVLPKAVKFLFSQAKAV